MAHKTTGLVLGKFMPLHQGHELLLNFARNYVDQLYVVVDRIKDEAFSGEQRCKWVKETIPDAQVFFLNQFNPQTPEEHPDFWQIWQTSLISLLPKKPDYVFASETYGFKLAEILDAKFIPFDMKREKVQINATRIRADIYTNWSYLSAAAKKDLTMRICIFGPESTGKSTLAKQLAEHFNTVYVPEYARLFIEAKGEISEPDMLLIAKGQAALEDSILPEANRLLICDTDPLTSSIWSKWLFGKCSTEIMHIANSRSYDFYLVTSPDLLWEADQTRFFPKHGKEFMQDCLLALKNKNKPFAIIEGFGPLRMQNAIEIISAELVKFLTYKCLSSPQ